MELHHIFLIGARGQASDIIVKVGQVPKFRRNGNVVGLQDARVVSREVMDSWIQEMMPPFLKERYEENGDVDFAFEDQVGTRFRVNVFRQSGVQGFVARIVNNYIKSIDELGLPSVLHKMTQFRRGIVLVTGSVGSGKSTTLAATVQQINNTYPYHIITIEDPVEYLYQDVKSMVNQREVGIDTRSFQAALKAGLRQSPDVIVVGEMRDPETVKTALMAAETGILVFSTLHTMDVVETFNRVLSFFPESDHGIIRSQLSRTLMMCVSQRLLPSRDGQSRVVAAEVMVVNERVREIIEGGKDIHLVHDVIKQGKEYYGMQTFDQSLLELYRNRKISRKMAFAHAHSVTDLAAAMDGLEAAS